MFVRSAVPSMAGLLLLLADYLIPISGHGYLLSPRSRNYVAHQDGRDWISPNDSTAPSTPWKEDCPHCLSMGGVCGTSVTSYKGGKLINYNDPPNALGNTMPSNNQDIFLQGEIIELETVLTAHHRGHFEFKACKLNPINQPAPTQACFDSNPLEFIEDVLYGAPKDPKYTGRAYIAPPTVKGALYGESPYGMIFRHRFKLPAGLHGRNILLQWHYVTGNSCHDVGYQNYNFPWAENSLGTCTQPLPLTGIPEQFWNCAEISILSASRPAPIQPSGPTAPTPTMQNPLPTPSQVMPPVISPSNKPKYAIMPTPAVPSPTKVANTGSTNYCGATWSQANSKCSVACPLGKNSECPSDEFCFSNCDACAANSAPVTLPAGNNPNQDYSISSSPRCGVSELDAREMCGHPCTHNGQCPGGLCWGTHANYCDDPEWVSPYSGKEKQNKRNYRRCGKTGMYGEVHARSHCGKPCSSDDDCARNETCYDVHSNYCPPGDVVRRKLRGI